MAQPAVRKTEFSLNEINFDRLSCSHKVSREISHYQVIAFTVGFHYNYSVVNYHKMFLEELNLPNEKPHWLTTGKLNERHPKRKRKRFPYH